MAWGLGMQFLDALCGGGGGGLEMECFGGGYLLFLTKRNNEVTVLVV